MNASTTHETALTGVIRRRIWAHPEVTSHSLVVLTLDRLYVAPLAGTPKAELVAAAETGDLEELLGPYAIVVDLVNVRRVKLDLVTNSFIIEYAKRGMSSRLTVVFTTPEVADACFTKIWRRLGSGCQLQPYKRDTWSAGRAPIMLCVGALLVTAALALTLSVFEDMASARAAAQAKATQVTSEGAKPLPKMPVEKLLGWMDWRWVCGFGGVVAAVAQVWLYRRLTHPPRALELTRS